jgi:SAM-dependent methyltransferase
VTERGLVFGEVAELYDAHRAGYPDELLDDVVEFAGVGPGDRVLEVGGGTGIATRGLATRGLAIHVVEPSEEMAAVLRARTIGLPVTVDGCRFEHWTPDAAYPLLVSAQAWHWVDRATRWPAARTALADDGAIALFGHKPRPAGDVGERIVALQRAATAPELRRPYSEDLQYAREFATELAASGLFRAVEHRDYHFTRRYDAQGFVRLMATMSDTRLLAADDRERVDRELARLIDGAGGRVDVDYRTDLYLARVAGPA